MHNPHSHECGYCVVAAFVRMRAGKPAFSRMRLLGVRSRIRENAGCSRTRILTNAATGCGVAAFVRMRAGVRTRILTNAATGSSCDFLHPPMACMVRNGLMKRAVLISWPSHLSATLRRIDLARSASSAAPPRSSALTSTSSSANRQLRSLPSAVRRTRLQRQAERPRDRGDDADAAAAVG